MSICFAGDMFVCCTGGTNGTVVGVVKSEEAIDPLKQEILDPEHTVQPHPTAETSERPKVGLARGPSADASAKPDEPNAESGGPENADGPGDKPPEDEDDQPSSPVSPTKSALKKKSVAGNDEEVSPISRGRSTMFKEQAEVVAIPNRIEVLKAKAEQLKLEQAARGIGEITNHYQTYGRTSTVHALQLTYIANPGKLWDEEPKSEDDKKEAEVRKSVLPDTLGPAGLRSGADTVSGPEDTLESHYTVGDKLRNGAFGSICKCTSKPDGKEYCLKQVNMSAVEEAGQAKMFNAEIEIETKLQHPNVIWLEHVFRDDEHVSFVMEMLDGGDLFEHLACKDRKKSVAKTASVAWQLISAVAYLHHNRIVHRDVRPENCLFSSTKPMAELKLIDFGLARTFEKGTAMHSIVGALAFVAPEVLQGSYSEKCDIWSVGVVAFLTCTGYLPIYENSDERWALATMKGNVNWGAMISNADAKIRNVIMSMLTINGDVRPTAASYADNKWLMKTATTAPKDCCVQ